VRRLAHQMIARLPANVELDDMIQAGMMGLLDAAKRYEEAQGWQPPESEPLKRKS
jgi:RNA polymerase sigma factor for flagellar operon FliA